MHVSLLLIYMNLCSPQGYNYTHQSKAEMWCPLHSLPLSWLSCWTWWLPCFYMHTQTHSKFVMSSVCCWQARESRWTRMTCSSVVAVRNSSPRWTCSWCTSATNAQVSQDPQLTCKRPYILPQVNVSNGGFLSYCKIENIYVLDIFFIFTCTYLQYLHPK